MINYFQVLNLPETFDIIAVDIEENYIELQLKYHPDQVNDIDKKNKYLQQSINLNQAYKILRQPHTRAEHLLALQGVNLYDPKFRSMISNDFLTEIFQLQNRMNNGLDSNELQELEVSALQSYNDIVQELSLSFAARNYQQIIINTMKLKYWHNIINAVRNYKNDFN